MDEGQIEDAVATPPRRGGGILELLRFAVVAILIILPIRFFVAQPFIVSGASMEPTFDDGEYLIVDELSYYLRSPERGEVVIFRYPRDPSKFFIKRVIGLPEETIVITSNEVTIKNNEDPDGFLLPEDYLTSPNRNGSFERTLGENEYFVMGDNRAESSDSRYWGAVPENLLVGRAFLRLFPFQRLALLPGDFSD